MGQAQKSSAANACPHCGGTHLYTRRVASGSAEGPYLLAGLGSFMHYAAFDAIVCADCGLTRLFAEPAARENIQSSAEWERL
jgi:predicted nucleic-acid-binding Zn-ribbon protein